MVTPTTMGTTEVEVVLSEITITMIEDTTKVTTTMATTGTGSMVEMVVTGDLVNFGWTGVIAKKRTDVFTPTPADNVSTMSSFIFL